MNRAEELLAQVLKKEKEECKACKIILWVLAVVGIIAAVAGIAYAVYRFVKPDYLEDYEDDIDDEFDYDDDFFDDDDDLGFGTPAIPEGEPVPEEEGMFESNTVVDTLEGFGLEDENGEAIASENEEM